MQWRYKVPSTLAFLLHDGVKLQFSIRMYVPALHDEVQTFNKNETE